MLRPTTSVFVCHLPEPLAALQGQVWYLAADQSWTRVTTLEDLGRLIDQPRWLMIRDYRHVGTLVASDHLLAIEEAEQDILYDLLKFNEITD